MKQFRNSILMPVLIGVLTLCITPSAWADESALEFRVAPSPGSATSDGGDYFVLAMAPGEVATQSITLSNPSSQRLDVQMTAVDAATAQMGGVDYGAEQVTPTSTGAWVALEDDRVRLGPGDSAEVQFEVSVPTAAVSGVHLAGIVAWVEGDEARAVEGAAATMNVQSRRVIAVQVDLPGPAAPMLEIRGAEAEARPDGLYLGIDLFNSGNGFAKGTGTVSIEGVDGQDSFLLDTMVPRTGTIYPFRWASSSIPSGSYEVSITIDYGGPVVTYNGEVVVGSAVQGDLRGRGVEDGTRSGRDRYLFMAGALVLIVCAALLFRRGFPSARLLPRLRRGSPGHTARTKALPLRSTPQHTVVRLHAPQRPTTRPSVPLRMEVQRRSPQSPPPPPARRTPPPPPPRLTPPPPAPPLNAGCAA